jgi:hypothetical protein
VIVRALRSHRYSRAAPIVAVWYIAAMDDERLRRARAEAEVARLDEEVELLAAERRRLSLRNERLSAVLYVLRDRERDAVVQDLIEDALAFDGREPDPPARDDEPAFTLVEAGPDDE